MGKEKNFENQVKKYLKEKGAWYIKYWGGASYTKAGIPDLLVCYKGVFIAIELKAETGKPSDLQLYQLKEIDKAGGFAILLYPHDFQQFQHFMEDIEHGNIPARFYDVYPFIQSSVNIENYFIERNR